MLRPSLPCLLLVVIAWLVAPADAPVATLARAQCAVPEAKQAGGLANALETRKIVDRAKGILMDSQSLTEQEAFRRIQKMSMNTRRPMKEIAEAIILASEMKNDQAPSATAAS